MPTASVVDLGQLFRNVIHEAAVMKAIFACGPPVQVDPPPPRSPQKVRTKRTMYELLEAGVFGNTSVTWKTVQEALDASPGPFAIRVLVPASPKFKHTIAREDLRETVADVCRSGNLSESEIRIVEPLPEHLRTVQGEITRLAEGQPYLFYSTLPCHMRAALLPPHGKVAIGSGARAVLNHYLDPTDVEWLDTLLDRFPTAVVEFTGFKVRLGTQHTRMVVWECRDY